MDIVSAIKDLIFPQQQVNDKELELLKTKAEAVENEAKLITEKATLVERINKAKGAIAEAKGKMKGTPSALGGKMSKKWILWIIGTIVLFALIKLMGC